ncbi:MAG: helix-turn-helix domain-containing protein [Prevotella sp.]|nr:helix-turn-helix domain-containing protein [Prevotella sp.]
MNDNNYITIQGWMRTRLNLKGVELMVYAIIYGFSQDGESVFSGTARYLAEWVGVTRRSMMDILKKLVDKGLLVKIDKVVNGVGLVDYKVNLKSVENFIGYEKFSQGGCEKMLHHIDNIDNNITTADAVVSNPDTHKKKHFWVKGYSDAECWSALRGCRKLDNKVLMDMAEGGAMDIDLNGRLIWRFGEGLDREAAFEVLKERAKEKKEQEGIDKKKKEVV